MKLKPPLPRNRKVWTVADVRHLIQWTRGFTDSHGRASAGLARQLQQLEKRKRFTPAARSLFQTALGVLGIDSRDPIRMPADDTPYWLRNRHPLAGFRSKSEMPGSTDIVIIGAGLTGTSAAYHLSQAARGGKRIVVLDKSDPASEASGRNGGNFELLPENSVGIYEGLARERLGFLRRCYPDVPPEILRIESERQASVVLGLALRNRQLLKQIIEQENIDCDFAPKGWLYLAHTESEEQAICDEVILAAEQRQRIELWSRVKIRSEFGFDREHIGRFIPGDGSYDPFKFVCGLLEKCLASGIELYTRVAVREIKSSDQDHHLVVTEEGEITAGRVIVAVNAFTSRIFPELSAIRPAQSQIAITEFAPDRCRGRIVTSEEGPVYFNQPRARARNGLAPLLLGGGTDRPTDDPSARRRDPRIHAKLLRLREKFYPELKKRPFSAEWVGACGYTPDELPVVGILRPGVVIAAGFNGYGGSYFCAAGQAAATIAHTGETPHWLPQDVLSPDRFLARAPLFLSHTDSLWRIGASLCAQLRAVNSQISEAIAFATKKPRAAPGASSESLLSTNGSRPGRTTDPQLVRSLPGFSRFSKAEAEELLGLMRRWDLPRGTSLFPEGSIGTSCFLVLSGAVNVTMQVRGEQQLLATLQAGSIFGQIAMIEGSPRTATCRIHKDAALLEIDRDSCQTLFATRSDTAVKFLAALNRGLISALRSADRQLMRLTVEGARSGDGFA